MVYVDSLVLLRNEVDLHSKLPTKETTSKKGITKTKTVFKEEVLIDHLNCGDVSKCHCAFFDVIGLFNVLHLLYGSSTTLLEAIVNYSPEKRKRNNSNSQGVKKQKTKVGCKCSVRDCKSCTCKGRKYCNENCACDPSICKRRPVLIICHFCNKARECVKCSECSKFTCDLCSYNGQCIPCAEQFLDLFSCATCDTFLENVVNVHSTSQTNCVLLAKNLLQESKISVRV